VELVSDVDDLVFHTRGQEIEVVLKLVEKPPEGRDLVSHHGVYVHQLGDLQMKVANLRLQ